MHRGKADEQQAAAAGKVKEKPEPVMILIAVRNLRAINRIRFRFEELL